MSDEEKEALRVAEQNTLAAWVKLNEAYKALRDVDFSLADSFLDSKNDVDKLIIRTREEKDNV